LTTTTPQDAGSKTSTPNDAKPFDRWRPIGGGTEQDIFQRFKISATEEAAFLMYWAEMSSGRSILSHDEDGNLIIRINPADISELADLRIGGLDTMDGKAQWLQVYDQEGVSWLTQSASADRAPTSTGNCYAVGAQTIANNALGLYGPSGLTVKEYMEQHQLDLPRALSPNL
jgi:hypothetical protein